MSWDRISFGFNVEDETQLFGTRAVALGEGTVFESTTFALIESSDVVSNIVSLLSLNLMSKCYI